MRKSPLNTKGFGLISVLLAVVVLAIIGGSGAYVYHKNHKAKTSTTTSSSKSSSSTQNNTPTPVDPYAGWKTGTLGSTGLSLKYPSDWTMTDTAACDGAHLYTVDAPSSEVQQSALAGVSRYGLTVITNAEVSGTAKCAPSASSLAGVALSAKSQSVLIDKGVLKGKYAVVDSDSNGISGISVLNSAYGPTQKLTETGVISAGNASLQVTSSLSAGQNPATASVSGFQSSQLYKDTLSILDSLTAN